MNVVSPIGHGIKRAAANGLIRPTKALLRGVKHNHEVINIFLVVIVAIASILFAWNTQKISNKQTNILNRQIEIQASQTLPLFHLDTTQELDENGSIMTKKLILSNRGGLARNAEVSVLTWVQFGWTPDGPPRYAVIGYGVPIPGFYLPDNISGALDGQETIYGVENNERDYQAYANQIKQRLEQHYGAGKVSYYIDTVMHVQYTDYMGNARDEYYAVIINKDSSSGEHVVTLYPISSTEGESLVKKFRDDLNAGFVIRAVGTTAPTVNPKDVDTIARYFYDEAHGGGSVATPTSNAND